PAVAVALAALSLAAVSSVTVHAGTPPPPATFTANARGDAAATTSTTHSAQKEPQVAVDQTGRAYVDWQQGTNSNGTSAAASTDDGGTFNYLGVPDNHTDVIDGDVDMATTSWPALGVHTPSVAGSGDNGV